MIPSHLYHYTSFETLLKIIANNSIRFNRLDRMNDPYDGQTNLYPHSRNSVFTSSWTSEEKDELPMWKIYSGLDGVRIRLPIDAFNHEGNLVVAKLNNGDNFLIKSQLDKPYLINRKGLVFESIEKADDELKVNSVFGPTKIDYFDSEIALDEDVIVKRGDLDFEFYEINLHLIGQKKHEFWNFEKEYRYRIFYGNAIKLAGSKEILDKTFKENPITTEFIDIAFKAKSLENIEILLGPSSSKESMEKIESVLNDKNLNSFSILKSKIKIR